MKLLIGEVNIPAWIKQDITAVTVKAIVAANGVKSSGYDTSNAMSIMSVFGDEIFDYIEARDERALRRLSPDRPMFGFMAEDVLKRAILLWAREATQSC